MFASDDFSTAFGFAANPNLMRADGSGSNIVTVERFAGLLEVSKNTVYGWISNDVLKSGDHYFMAGNIIRILVDEALHGLCLYTEAARAPREDGKPAPSMSPSRTKSSRLNMNRSTGSGINLDY